MPYASAYAAPKRFQWESNSAPSQSWNCGPTCITQMVQFYRDTWYGIEATRLLVTRSYTPTNSWQQRDMAIRRGVPATVRWIDTLAELHGLVDSGRRPTLIGIEMIRVPSAVRGHPFTGWHALLVLGRAYVNGVDGFWVTDPNFSPPGGIRPDPQKGTRFYSDAVMQYAFIGGSSRYAVVPDSLKAITSITQYVKFNSGVNGVNLRTAPDARKDNVYATAWSDADPKPNGIVRPSGQWVGNTGARRTLYGTVQGADGYTYNRLRLKGTGLYTYVQSRFMHKV